jgi:hypothetical protein
LIQNFNYFRAKSALLEILLIFGLILYIFIFEGRPLKKV